MITLPSLSTVCGQQPSHRPCCHSCILIQPFPLDQISRSHEVLDWTARYQVDGLKKRSARLDRTISGRWSQEGRVVEGGGRSEMRDARRSDMSSQG